MLVRMSDDLLQEFTINFHRSHMRHGIRVHSITRRQHFTSLHGAHIRKRRKIMLFDLYIDTRLRDTTQ